MQPWSLGLRPKAPASLRLNVSRYLPTEHLLLGNRSWGLSKRVGQFADHLERAHIVSEGQAAAALGLAKFNGRQGNRSVYRSMLVGYLEGFADKQHLWFNVTKTGAGAHYVISKATPCPEAPHAGEFLHCLGKLMTTPSRGLQAQVDVVKKRLSRDPTHAGYTAVHARTFAADMGVPRTGTPNPRSVLSFMAWEVQVNESAYTAAVLDVCATAARRNLSLFVASDSRSAVAMFENLCPGQVEQVGASFARVHLVSRALYKNESQASSSLIDWVVMSEAKQIVRWGALHSSFTTSAGERGCRPRMGRSPHGWKYASAGMWLINKIRGASYRHRSDDEHYDCNSPLAGMVNSTPCQTPCLKQCIDMMYAAYA